MAAAEAAEAAEADVDRVDDDGWAADEWRQWEAGEWEWPKKKKKKQKTTKKPAAASKTMHKRPSGNTEAAVEIEAIDLQKLTPDEFHNLVEEIGSWCRCGNYIDGEAIKLCCGHVDDDDDDDDDGNDGDDDISDISYQIIQLHSLESMAGFFGFLCV